MPSPTGNLGYGGAVAGYDKLAGTWDPAVDPVLWPMLCVHSQLIDSIPKDTVPDPEFEWETANTVTRTVVDTNAAGASTVLGSAAFTANALAISIADAAKMSVGDVIRNVTRATPVGTYGADELMEVTAIAAPASAPVLTLVRDAANQSGSVGTGSPGSALHTASDSFEIVFPSKPEGSSVGPNRYQDVTLVKAHTQILDMYLTVTGSQMAAKRLVVGDNLARQFDDRVIELTNFVESMFTYGAEQQQGATAGVTDVMGASGVPRRTKGFANYVVTAAGYANGVVDYQTKDVTEYSINTIMQRMADNGQDMSAHFLIAGNNFNMRKISAFGADKVRITQDMTVWGRALKSYETDLGVDLTMNPCHNITKSDLFIVNTNKCRLVTFRPFEAEEWGKGTSTPNGVDAWNKRYLGEVGVKIIDGTKAHGAITGLPWS